MLGGGIEDMRYAWLRAMEPEVVLEDASESSCMNDSVLASLRAGARSR